MSMQNRVLIVDDEPAIISTLRAILELHGFTVEAASSAAAGTAALNSAAFDAIITDLKMETPTAGYEVVEVARGHNPQPATIILSAYPDLCSEWKVRGAHAFFEKPVNTADLLRKIEDLLGDRRIVA
jgi:DNA-binding NtrC family response regulator